MSNGIVIIFLKEKEYATGVAAGGIMHTVSLPKGAGFMTLNSLEITGT